MSGIEIWPIIFYKDTISNILTRHLGRDDEINDNDQNNKSIKNQLISKSEFNNLQNSLSEDTIKSNIANYLSKKFKGKNKQAIIKLSNNITYSFTNPFTGEIYSNEKQLNNLGGGIADKYILFFNLFSINFIKDTNRSNNKNDINNILTEKGYSKIKNNIFVGILEYYHNASLVLKNIIKQICNEYSIAENKICERKNKDNKNKDNKKKDNKKKDNKKVHIKGVKSLLDENNTNMTNETVNNAKIIISINDQIKKMVKKAQNAENYDQLNRITEFIEEHEDKLKEMDYANAVKLLNNIQNK